LVFLQPTGLIPRLSCIFAGAVVLASYLATYRSRCHPKVTTIHAYDKVLNVQALDTLRTLHISMPDSRQSLVVCNLDAIHTLRFSSLMNTSSDCWRDLLSRIHTPTPSDVPVTRSNGNIEDTISFLSRHSGITEMSYTPTSIPNPPPSIPFDLLPNLKLLKASPEFVGFIHETPGSLPSLEKIEFNVHRRTEPFIEPLKMALRNMVTRKTDIHLEIVIPEDTPQTDSLADDDSKDDPGYVVPCVKTLSLFWFAKKTVGMVPRWLRRFPELKHLKLADTNLNVNDRVLLIRVLRESCPKLESLMIGATEKPVEEWL